MHTTASDGTAPLDEMAAACRASGYEYAVVTDHSKGLAIANGMNEERLDEQHAEVIRVNEALARDGAEFRVLQGIEMNLSPAGEGDMEPDALGRLDVVLGAFHSKLRLKEDQTGRFLAGVRNRHVDVLAHPRGRIFNTRAGLAADWEHVFAAASEAGTALEVDCYPDRQDLDVPLLRAAAEGELFVSIGTDAHSTGELRFMPIGIATAILAGFPRERILNFMPAERLLARTRS
jgi:histidinol phosphatase-like PHP family hydrolase